MPVVLGDPRGGGRDVGADRAPLGDRRPFGAPYDTLTFPLVTRGRRELTVTLAAQPVFDLAISAPVGRRVRRAVRHAGGESALYGAARRTLDQTDLRRIDLQTLSHGMDLLRQGQGDSGVLPAFWRTVQSSGGRFALICDEIAQPRAGPLLVELAGGLEHARPELVRQVSEHFERSGVGLVLHLAPDPAAVVHAAAMEPQCLAFDFAGVAHESAREWDAAQSLIAAARRISGQVLLVNLRPDRGLAAKAAGATHAVFAGMEPITV